MIEYPFLGAQTLVLFILVPIAVITYSSPIKCVSSFSCVCVCVYYIETHRNGAKQFESEYMR